MTIQNLTKLIEFLLHAEMDISTIKILGLKVTNLVHAFQKNMFLDQHKNTLVMYGCSYYLNLMMENRITHCRL